MAVAQARRARRCPPTGTRRRPGRGAIIGAVRFFNTAGPVVPADHYLIPPLSRVDLDGILMLIRQKKYFVLHAPRQTGKTSALLALRDLLNTGSAGPFRCVHANLEVGQAAREDTGRAMRAVLAALAESARLLGDGFLEQVREDILAASGPDNAVATALTRWSEADPRPLVLLLDEVDALVGDSLLALLRQLRAGYERRPSAFPQSVVLCGLRDVADYRMEVESGKRVIAAGSPFNIVAKSLRLGDFTEEETSALLAQHTGETGQEFLPAAAKTAWDQTRGQPWLVNALAYEACFESERGRDRSRPIGAEDILTAREALIRRRNTHIHQLGEKLREDRVRRVIEPLLTGGGEDDSTASDVDYTRNLGLIAADDPLRIANPIYREVIPRELTRRVQSKLPQEASWYATAERGLDVGKLLGAFQEFFREHSEHWVERFEYREAGPQLLLQAFLQRLVNSGGRVEREYGLGRGRTDLLLLWPRDGDWEKFVVECKIQRRGRERTEREGLSQTAAYMDRCGAASGHLVIFDRDPARSWSEKIYRREGSADPPITVWGM